MPEDDITLRWRFPPAQDGRDLRTFNVFLELGTAHQPMHLYKFLTIPGVAETVTTFERWNISLRRWEVAGEIHWTSHFGGTVQFGIQTLQLHEIRKRDRQHQGYRGFVANDAEYKWRIADNGKDQFCIDPQGRTVATWAQDAKALRVVESAQPILDRIVVSCLVHLWLRANGQW